MHNRNINIYVTDLDLFHRLPDRQSFLILYLVWVPDEPRPPGPQLGCSPTQTTGKRLTSQQGLNHRISITVVAFVHKPHRLQLHSPRPLPSYRHAIAISQQYAPGRKPWLGLLLGVHRSRGSGGRFALNNRRHARACLGQLDCHARPFVLAACRRSSSVFRRLRGTSFRARFVAVLAGFPLLPLSVLVRPLCFRGCGRVLQRCGWYHHLCTLGNRCARFPVSTSRRLCSRGWLYSRQAFSRNPGRTRRRICTGLLYAATTGAATAAITAYDSRRQRRRCDMRCVLSMGWKGSALVTTTKGAEQSRDVCI